MRRTSGAMAALTIALLTDLMAYIPTWRIWEEARGESTNQTGK